MKKTLALAIVGLAAGLTTSSYGQGALRVDNYDTSGPYITYGPGTDGTAGTGLNSSYTMGIYIWNALGNFVGSTLADPTGSADPTTLGSYILGTGAGSTAPFGYGGIPGAARAGTAWAVPIVPGPTGGDHHTYSCCLRRSQLSDRTIQRSLCCVQSDNVGYYLTGPDSDQHCIFSV